MKKEITINKDWYNRLKEILELVESEIIMAPLTKCTSIYRLRGFIESLDEYFKD